MSDDTPPSPTRRALLAGAASLAAMPSARAKQTAGTKHVVLLGDSVFDNTAYVGDGPDVMAQVQAALPDWVVSLGGPYSSEQRLCKSHDIGYDESHADKHDNERYCEGDNHWFPGRWRLLRHSN
jgi:hypothetical protein